MAQLTGIVFLRVDGELLQSLPEAKLMLGGYARTTRTGHRVYGYHEKVVPGGIECEVVHSSDTPLEDLRNKTGAVVLFETDTGVTYQVSNAHVTDTFELSGGEGQFSVKMEGDPAEKQ